MLKRVRCLACHGREFQRYVHNVNISGRGMLKRVRCLACHGQ